MVTKTKYVAYVATSIDGRIAKNSLSKVDWTSKEDWNFFQKSLTQSTAVIVGSHTYKNYRESLKKRNTIVLTSKVPAPKIEGSVIFLNPKKSNIKDFVHSKKYKKVAVIGGSKVYDFCLKNKMLDELFVTVEPYVFTTGVPMFSSNIFKKYKFKLQSIKKLNKKGTILLQYKYQN